MNVVNIIIFPELYPWKNRVPPESFILLSHLGMRRQELEKLRKRGQAGSKSDSKVRTTVVDFVWIQVSCEDV